MESGKCRKYQRFYQRQHLAFAPMVTNSLGQCGQDLLQFLWNLADHYAQTMFGFSLDENTTQSSTQSTQQAANYSKLWGQKYNENSQRILTCIFEGITTRLYGITFHLTCSPQYTKWFEQLQHNWSPVIPKFDMDLVSSPRTSQSSQFSNSMPSPTKHIASTKSSQLEHPSFFSNLALMDGSNPQSLCAFMNSLSIIIVLCEDKPNQNKLNSSHPGFIAATHFIPASKPSGSSYPTGCDFSKHHFFLSSIT